MGFLANTFNSVQFKVVQPQDGDRFKPEYIAEALSEFGFRPITDAAAEKSLGWVNIHDSSVATFADSGLFCVDDHLAFSLRIDQRKVPGAVLRERCKVAGEEFLQANPTLTRISKQKREDIKEAQRALLLAQIIPTPTIYDVEWDLTTNVITFCHLSPRAMEVFQDLFKRTFEDARLRLITPYDRAFSICDRGDMDGKYLPLLQAANKASSDSVMDLINENQWLGSDFLLWLLSMDHDGGFVRPEVTAYIDQKILLVGAGDNGAQKIVCSGDQSGMQAVKAAIASGKQITVARIFMDAGDDRWAVTLRGSNFESAQFKCPAVRLEKDNVTDGRMEQQAVFLERVAMVNKGRSLLDGVFAYFLQIRLGEAWPRVLEQIQDWANGDI